MSKGHLFTEWELKQQGRAFSHSISSGNVYVRPLNFFTALCMSTNDCKSTVSIFQGYKFYQVSEFTNTESVNNEDLLYVFLVFLQIDLLIKLEFIISKIL